MDKKLAGRSGMEASLSGCLHSTVTGRLAGVPRGSDKDNRHVAILDIQMLHSGVTESKDLATQFSSR